MGGRTAATLVSYSTHGIVKRALVAPVGLDVPEHPTIAGRELAGLSRGKHWVLLDLVDD